MQRPLAQENWLGGQVRAEQVALDSSSLFPQSLSPSQSQRLGMQRLFSHLNRSEGQVCWWQRAGASSLPSRQSLSPSHFQRSWMQRLLEQANSPGWHWGGGT